MKRTILRTLTVSALALATSSAWATPVDAQTTFRACRVPGVGAIYMIGLPGLPNVPRLVLAIPAGIVCGWFLAIGLGDWVRHRSTPRRQPSVVTGKN